MIDSQALLKVKEVVKSNRGEKVHLKANSGRRKIYVKEGVIYDTYPNIFTVQVDIDERNVQMLSYTYFDILTSNVELIVCKNNQKI
ncbi:MAG: Veg family protein [Xylanivirga thermophila]|uniref:Veg family protein n=1 Tax=Xylanivirga thermophila TaxID=2496273 RepID=UPI00101D6A65|nr:Veg family protein [Xylanivirga thermophila]